MGAESNPCRDAPLHVGGAAPRRAGALHGVDAGRQTAASCFPRAARRQTGAGSDARNAEQLVAMGQKSELEVDGRALTVSNLDKVLYPEAGFTKAQVID